MGPITSTQNASSPPGLGALAAPEVPSPLVAMTPQLAAYLGRKSPKPFADRVRDLPMSGIGKIHNAIHSAALAGLSEGLSPEFVQDALLKEAHEKNRPGWIANREVTRAVSNAYSYLFDSDPGLVAGVYARVPRPTINVPEILRIASGGGNLATLEALSGPIPSADIFLLFKLFGIASYVCCGATLETCETRRVGDWPKDLRMLQFIVPNPMTAATGINKEGKISSRCLDNTAPRRKYIVVEFDFKKEGFVGWQEFYSFLSDKNLSVGDVNAALHLHLQQYLPLGMVVFSGNESLHGWYPVMGVSEEDQDRFINYSASLGADQRVFMRCQLVRIPGGTRSSNGAFQKIIYYNNKLIS